MNLKSLADMKLPAYLDGKIQEITLGSLVDEYLVLIFYPYDFTTVCPSEINTLSDHHDEFQQLKANLSFISCDSVFSHQAWAQIDPKDKGIKGVKYPLLSDYTKELTKQLWLLNKDGACKRATVILDRQLNVLYYSFSINEIGRSSKELKRIIRALTFNKNSKQMCLMDWDE
ncbi:hypothetical protein H312_00839 [Anncaliia algerae PRA339]|uniref:Thioredoxin domain-containing protein n=2 Tax=Opisthokonta TaxID=33154 RepID=A0A059F3Y8_9MICR|nr:hypothetical protein H312_00839 [Anncaliia algerae PRA339]